MRGLTFNGAQIKVARYKMFIVKYQSVLHEDEQANLDRDF